MSTSNSTFSKLVISLLSVAIAVQTAAQTSSSKTSTGSTGSTSATSIPTSHAQGSRRQATSAKKPSQKSIVTSTDSSTADAKPAVSPPTEASTTKEFSKPSDNTADNSDTADKAKIDTKPQVAVPADPIELARDRVAGAATPDDRLRSQFQLVDALVAKGAKQEAMNELRAMSDEDHFNPPGFYNIGNALARLGDAEGATTAYRKAIDQKKGRYSKALNNLGVIQMRQGRWDEAYQSFMTALRLESFHYAEASYNLGRLYAARGESDLAVREWHRAVAVDPEHTAARRALASAGSAGTIAVAKPSLPPPVPKRIVPDDSKAPGKSPTKQPQPPTPKPSAAARPASAPRLTVDPETYAWLQRARTARELDREEEAVANYRKVISRMGGYFAPANLEMAYVLINLKRTDEALASLEAVAKADGSRFPITYYHLGRLYEARGDLKMAEQEFSRAASFSQDNAQFLLDVSRVRERIGDLPGALTALESYLAAMERQNLKPEWSADRVAYLKQKIATQPK